MLWISICWIFNFRLQQQIVRYEKCYFRYKSKGLGVIKALNLCVSQNDKPHFITLHLQSKAFFPGRRVITIHVWFLTKASILLRIVLHQYGMERASINWEGSKSMVTAAIVWKKNFIRKIIDKRIEHVPKENGTEYEHKGVKTLAWLQFESRNLKEDKGFVD